MDTYVFNYGYGEFNEINNYTEDKIQDTLQLGFEFDNVELYFHGENNVIVASKTRPSSLTVQILNFRGEDYQHLQVKTADKVIFKVTKENP